MELLEKHIEAALDEIDQKGIPSKRRSTGFCLIRQNNRRHYPPKYVLALAYQLIREPYPWKNHLGGDQTNRPLRELGYIVESCNCRNATMQNSN